MARKTKREKLVEAASEAAFNKHGSGKQFNIFDLSKISAAGINAGGKEGEVPSDAIEQAVKAACDQYEKK